MGFNYIIFKKEIGGVVRELPVIYPDMLSHSDVAKSMSVVPGMKGFTPVSAGQLQLVAESCSGQSRTLNLSSREDDDQRLINSFPYAHGVR